MNAIKFLCFIILIIVANLLLGCFNSSGSLNEERSEIVLPNALKLTKSHFFVNTNESLILSEKNVLEGQPPYRYTIDQGIGTIDETTGLYKAPAVFGFAIVKITDRLNGTGLISIEVTDLLKVNVTEINMVTGSKYTLVVSGGRFPYQFTVSEGQGVTVDGNGVISAGTLISSPVVRVTDALGQEQAVFVSVIKNLIITPENFKLITGGTQNLVVEGGVGHANLTVQSGDGVILDSPSRFTAGMVVGTSKIQASDEMQNKAYANVTINNKLQINPSSIMIPKNELFTSFTGTGGIPPYTYSVIGSGLVDINTGIYAAPANSGASSQIQVTDSIGNSSTATVTVTDSFRFIVKNAMLGTLESIDFTTLIDGGIAPFTLSVSPSGGTKSGLIYTAPATAGTYAVTITDSAAHSVAANILVYPALQILPAQLNLPINSTKSFTIRGGIPPYVFTKVSGVGSVDTTSGLFTSDNQVGTANIQVTDANNHSLQASVNIVNRLSLVSDIQYLRSTDIANLGVAGGIGPYTFSIIRGSGQLNNATATSIEFTPGAIAGIAHLQVSDSLGDIAECFLQIASELNLIPNTLSIKINNLYTFTPQGGVAPYTFSLVSGNGTITSGGQYKAPATPGTDIVRIADSLNQIKEASVIVYDSLLLQPSTQTLVVGEGLQLSVLGGIPPFTYLLKNGLGQIAQSGFFTASNTPGTVTIQISDSQQNTSESILFINDVLSISPTTIDLKVASNTSFTSAGGIPPYKYSLTSTSAGLINIASGEYTAPNTAGIYEVVVRDSASGIAKATVNVTANQGGSGPPAPLAGTALASNIIINETTSVSGAGGVGPYFYSVISGVGNIDASTGIFTSSTAGNVVVQIKDSENSTVTVPIAIVNPFNLATSSATLQTGVVHAILASGGMPPYSYTITSGGGTLSGAFYTAPLIPGLAVIKVMDAASRFLNLNITITGPLMLNPLVANIDVNSLFTFIAVGGKAPYSFSVDSGIGNINVSTGEYLATTTGTASIKVTDADTTIYMATVNVYNPFAVAPLATNLPINQNFTISATGGKLPYVYNLTSGSAGSLTGALFQAGATSGTAAITVLDNLGQSKNISVVVFSPLILTPTTTYVVTSTPKTFIATGGITPYTFSKISGVGSIVGTTGEFFSSTAGTSIIRVTDAAASFLDANINVGAALSLNADKTIVNVTETATFTATGGVAPYVYSVASGLGSISASSGFFTAANSAGTVLVRATDAFGNFFEKTLSVVVPPTPPDHLALNSGAATGIAGYCYGPFTVTAKDAVNATTNVTAITNINLSGKSNGVFYTNSNCTGPTNVISMAADTSSVNFYFSDNTAEALTLTATDNSAALTSAQFNFTLQANSPAKLGYAVQPSDTVASNNITPSVQVAIQDINGNFVNSSGYLISIALGNNPTGSTLQGTLTGVSVNGLVSFSDLKINTVANAYTLVAANASLTSGTSNSFNILANPPAQLAFNNTVGNTSPSTVINPAITVRVTDLYGNLVTTASNSVTLSFDANPTSASLSGTTNKNAVNGVATFNDLSIDNVGSAYSLKATSGSLTQAISNSFNVIDISANSTVVANTNLAPSDNLAQVLILVTPKDQLNTNLGADQNIEVMVSSANVSLSGGANSCRVPSATCIKASYAGNGVYSITATSGVSGTYNFSAVLAASPDQNITQVASVNFDSSQFNIISNGTFNSITSANAAQNLYVTNGTASFDNSTVGVSFGILFIRGGTVKHLTTNTINHYKIDINVGALILQSGFINVSGLGYPSGYSFGASQPSILLSSGLNSGASHGGLGGKYAANMPGPTYGDYRNPLYAGAGVNSSGGGVVRITSAGACTIQANGSINANAATSGNGAGGSVYLNCSSFSGDAGASAISANGGYGSSTKASGGGGRVALITTGNVSAWTGNFTYPTNTSTANTIKSIIKAKGGQGTSATYPGGGAGTIYLKHSALNYGDLIVDNSGVSDFSTASTLLVSLAGTVNGAPTSTTLPITVSSYLNPSIGTAYINLYTGMKLRPDLNFTNSTNADWLDDNIITVGTNNTSLLASTATFSGVVTGATFRSIDILDHLELGGGAQLETNGDLYIIGGAMTAPGVNPISLNNVAIKFLGQAQTNAAIDLTLGTGNFNQTYNPNVSNLNLNSLTINGGFVSLASSNSTLNVGTLTMTGGTLNLNSINASGNITLSGNSVIRHLATTTSTVYALNINVGGNLSMSDASLIDANGLGYPSGYSFGASGPATSLASTGNAGASHGGNGGNYNSSLAGPTYGDYRDPQLPGAGSSGSPGGGIIRVNATGTCTINSGAGIKADGTANGGAGGSIYLNCGALGGNAGVNALSASGGNALGSGGGGGGRIALITTGNSGAWSGSFTYPNSVPLINNFKTTVKAVGGNSFSSTVLGGGAGTVYLKHSLLSYGDLIIDNGTPSSHGMTLTQIPSLSGILNGDPVGQTLNLTITGGTSNVNYTNLYKGMRLRPNLAFDNSSSTNWSDDNIVTIASNTATAFNATSTFLAGPTANGNSFRSIDILDHIDVGGGAIVKTFGDFYVLGGNLSNPGVTPIAFTDGIIKFTSGAQSNSTISLTITSGNYTNAFSSSESMIIHSLSMTGGTLTVNNLQTTSDLSLSGNAFLSHKTSETSSVYYSLVATIGGNFSMSGTSTINVDGLGYPGGYTGPGTPSNGGRASTGWSGGSHGGIGGRLGSSYAGTPYGNYRYPAYPGGGSGFGGIGGGVVRLTATGTCNINTGSTISADGSDSGDGGAGGSVNLSCAAFGGSADSNAITANGANSSYGGGGGGRIALISTGNVGAWTGNFIYPTDITSLNNFKAKIKVTGGTSSTYANGGAGTLYLKHSGLSNGDLIIDNGSPIANNYEAGTTFLLSLAGTVANIQSSTQLLVNATGSPGADSIYCPIYDSVKVRASLGNDSGTPTNWSDDNIQSVYSSYWTGSNCSLVTSATITGVTNGTAFRSIDILDHIDIGGGAQVETNGDLYVADGFLGSPGIFTLNLNNSIIRFFGNAQSNLNFNLNLASQNFSTGYLNHFSPTWDAGNLSAGTINMSSGSLASWLIQANIINLTGGTLTTNIIQTSGDLNLSGNSALKHQTPESSTIAYTLTATIGGNFSMNGTSTINLKGLGYAAGRTGPGSNPNSTRASSGYAGGSHGGLGGRSGSSYSGVTFDDYHNPSSPGGGPGSSGAGGYGGGAVRLTASGNCTINAGSTINADGTSNLGGGGGGTIYLNCASLAGSAGTNAISAKGADSSYGAGGGGRIALITTGNAGTWTGNFIYPTDSSTLTNFKSIVKANGGISTNYGNGGAGSVYLKHSGLSNGDLIINNDNPTANNYEAGVSYLVSLAGSVAAAPTGADLKIAATSYPNLGAESTYCQIYPGIKIRANLTNDYGSPNNWADDNIQGVAYSYWNGANCVYTTTATVTGVSNGNGARSIDILDHIDIDGGAHIETNGDLYVADGLIAAPGNFNLNLTNTVIRFFGSAKTNLNINLNMSSNNFAKGYLESFTSTWNSGNLSAGTFNMNGGSFAISGIQASSINISGGTLTTNSIQTTGDLVLSGAAVLSHRTPETSTSYYVLSATVGGNFTMNGTSSINLNGLGYSSGYTGPSTANSSRGSAGYAGGSHGGMGGRVSTSYAGVTYGDYRDPASPGGGGGFSGVGMGGGVLRLSATGACTIGAGNTISANGTDSMGGGAGGAIKLNCASFAGSASANAISARGANSTWGAGGGGRIALITTGNAGAWTGSFSYPTDSTSLTNIKAIVKVNGGTSTSYGNGGAGSIYLKHSNLTYGDLIIDNGNPTANTYEAGVSYLLSLAGSVAAAPTGTEIKINSTSYPNLSADSTYCPIYTALKLRGNLTNDYGTPNNWSDDNLQNVNSSYWNVANCVYVTTASVAGVSNGNSIRSIDILDHIDVDGGAHIETNGDLYLTDGLIAAPGSFNLNLTNTVVRFFGSAKTNLNINLNMSSHSFNTGYLEKYSTTWNAGNLSLGTLIMSSGSFSVSGITASNITITGGTLTTNSIQTTGDLSLSGSASIKHRTPETSARTYSLFASIGGNFALNDSSSLDATGLGYFPGRSYGSTGPSTSLASTNYSGGSHGGKGGFSSASNSGETFDDFRSPSLPGGGAGQSSGGYGGGSIALITTGTCTLNSGTKIIADGTNSNGGGAGGAIYMNCASFGGTAGANAISASGPNSSFGPGGGGRIALISSGAANTWTGSFAYPSDSTSLANFKSVVKVTGGTTSNAAYGAGAAGTLFIKNSDLSYGDLIIDNDNHTGTLAYTGSSKLVSSIQGTTGTNSILYNSPTAYTANIRSSGTPLQYMTNLFTNYLIHVFPTASSLNPADASHIAITLNGNSEITYTSTSPFFPVISSNYYYRFVYQLDHIDVGGKAIIDMNGADLYLMSGCDLHSASAWVFDVPANSSITGNSFSSTLCTDAATTTKGSTINFTNYFQP
jgi:hypothetical protein